jgi:integrase
LAARQTFRAVEPARVRYLSEAECLQLVNASEPAFRNLMRDVMLTGCRYSELTTMRVADFQCRRRRGHRARE